MRVVLCFMAAFLALAAPAFAHVTVLPEIARPGDTVELTFRVPNERDDAATTALEIFLPPGVPATIAPHKGWSHEDKGNGDIVWTPDTPDAAIGPGRTQDFKVTLGPLPQADRIVFKALQTYADGDIVRWIQDTGPDDERPAAVLDLSGRGRSGDDDGGSAALIIVVIAVPLIALVIVGVLVTRRLRRDT